MFNPAVIGLAVFAVILAGAFAGAVFKRRVPQHHLTEETKGLVSVSMALVATISALVLGLLLSHYNTILPDQRRDYPWSRPRRSLS